MPELLIFSGACTSPWRQYWVPGGFRDIQLGLFQRGKAELWSHCTSTSFNLQYNPNHHRQSETHLAMMLRPWLGTCIRVGVCDLCVGGQTSAMSTVHSECSGWSNRLSHSCFTKFFICIWFHISVVQPFNGNELRCFENSLNCLPPGLKDEHCLSSWLMEMSNFFSRDW